MDKIHKKDYDNKFRNEMMDQLNIRVLKRWNLKQAIAQAAQKRGSNSRQYMLNAILKQLKEDGYDITAIEGENKTD